MFERLSVSCVTCFGPLVTCGRPSMADQYAHRCTLTVTCGTSGAGLGVTVGVDVAAPRLVQVPKSLSHTLAAGCACARRAEGEVLPADPISHLAARPRQRATCRVHVAQLFMRSA